MITKLTNKQTKEVIELPYDLYPIDDLNWSPVVSTTTYLLNGAFDVQQGVKKAGKPITLQSNESLGLGAVTRDVVNQLHEQAKLTETIFTMEYLADGVIKSVDVIFDHAQTPIEATPVKAFNSPNIDDYFWVTIRFRTV